MNQNHKGAKPAQEEDPFLGNELPAALDTAAFRTSWGEWRDHRRQIGKKLTACAVGMQLTDLATYGHDGAVQSIRQSIKNGWTGLFPPKGNGGNGDGQGQELIPLDAPYDADAMAAAAYPGGAQ